MPKTWDVTFRLRLDLPKFDSLLDAIESTALNLRNLPLPPAALDRMEQLNIVRAIRGTTGLEGNTMTEEAVSRVVVQPMSVDIATVEERENLNAKAVMDFITATDTDKSPMVTQALIKRIHRLTTEGIQNAWNEPGKYRRDTVYADSFEFPAPEQVDGLMRDYVKFINGPTCLDLSPIVRALIAHFYLVSIHPFGDGNGRVARAVEAYVIFNSDFRAAGFYSLANFYYQNRKKYIDSLNEARLKYDGDITEFVGFALNGFLTELSGLVKSGIPYLRIVKYGQYIDRMVLLGEMDQRLATALKSIAETETGVTPREFVARIPPWVQRLYRGKSERTLRNELTLMRRSGLITERDGRIYPDLSVID